MKRLLMLTHAELMVSRKEPVGICKGSAPVLFTSSASSKVAVAFRRLVCVESTAAAREQPSGVSPWPHLLLGATHRLRSASFLLLDGPSRSHRMKRRRKEPVVYVRFISEEVLVGSPTREPLVISSRQAFCEASSRRASAQHP